MLHAEVHFPEGHSLPPSPFNWVNWLLAFWCAEKMGLQGDQAHRYATHMVEDVEDERLLEALLNDLTPSVPISFQELETEYRRLKVLIFSSEKNARIDQDQSQPDHHH